MTGSELARVMIPRTANLIVGRDPGEPESASVIAARSEPRPESLRVVTTIVRETGFVACAVAPPAGAATTKATALPASNAVRGNLKRVLRASITGLLP